MSVKLAVGTTAPVRKSVSVSLPTQKSAGVTSVNEVTMLIYGEQKIGKTSFTAQFKDCLHIMFEPSGKDYELFQVFPSSWEEFVAYVRELEKGGHPFKFVALDTIDLAFKMCQDFVCMNAGVDHPSAGAYGKLYQVIETEFRDVMIRLAKVCGFIALSHSKDREVKTKSGKEYTTTMPSAGKACNLILAKFCDVTGNYFMDEFGDRWLLIEQTPDTEAGNRLGRHFKYKGTETQISKIPMGSSPEESYSNFVKAFSNQLEKPLPKPTPSAQATPTKQPTGDVVSFSVKK